MGKRGAHPIMAAIVDAERALFDHVGYEHDWRSFPVVDRGGEIFWAVDPLERKWVRYSYSRDALQHWVDTEARCPGDIPRLFDSEIYAYSRLREWVFRGDELVMILEVSQADGTIWLGVYRADMEVKPKGG